MLPMPFEKWTTYEGHSGVDFPQPNNTPIPASGPGKVTAISYSETGGWRVWIQYDSGELIKYVHMDRKSDILVAIGERVNYGQTIALVGMLGKGSTGYHLHVENGNASGFENVWKVLDKNDWIGKNMPLSGADKQFIKDAIFEFLRDTGNIGNDGWKFVREGVMGQKINAQTPEGNLLIRNGKPVPFTFEGYIASTNAQVSALREVVNTIALSQGIDPKLIEEAAQRGAEKALEGLTLKAQ